MKSFRATQTTYKQKDMKFFYRNVIYRCAFFDNICRKLCSHEDGLVDMAKRVLIS